ncbi:Permease of the drug/metabolite transporter (DMT) superfamily [Sinomicrobium oceani]|uniref:Permease of the drug/metabolite transporter (DMT) superfamily n=1 Tax=Sinomicrobium oceani TaxID=1150368 RepID=A0A1K1LTL7_9FLAO|nr:DMT family transporter [Sinomicrobium oceani]SFW14277.1 Permease of the drug/metabolite transporter (DMT) superfamily [Sinomicrobium oceani]
MLNNNQKNYLHLHLIVFIWGFTAVLGALITVDAIPLVWYRMVLATFFVGGYIWYSGFSLRVPMRTLLAFILAGVVLALHWVAFFMAVKVSNVSVTLAMISTGALFTSVLEPIWYKRRVIWYELVLGLVVILGLYLIFRVGSDYVEGIVLALIAALLSSVFSLMNGKFVKQYRPSVISFYELLSGVAFLSVCMGGEVFTDGFIMLSPKDWLYLLVLASVCTAYALISSVKVMKYISPYTVMLTINMEPVYGILLAFMILGDTEKMNPEFYLGAVVILITVLANGVLKHREESKRQKNSTAGNGIDPPGDIGICR